MDCICRRENSWSGDGYYFWDTFIENAHWWGSEIRCYENGYLICKSLCDYNDERCFDLVGNTEHLLMLYQAYDLMKKEGLVNAQTTVKRVIEYFKINLTNFDYTAIRAYGLRSKNYQSRFTFTQIFENNRPAYLDYKPPIQICFFSRKSLNLRDYHIVYPEEYSIDFV